MKGNLTGLNIFTIFIGAINENKKLQQNLDETKKEVEELKGEIFLLSKREVLLALFSQLTMCGFISFITLYLEIISEKKEPPKSGKFVISRLVIIYS